MQSSAIKFLLNWYGKWYKVYLQWQILRNDKDTGGKKYKLLSQQFFNDKM